MVKNNILLVSDEEDYILYVKKQISLLRESDEIVSCSSSADIKKIIQKSGFNVILLKELNSTQSNIRTIQSIKDAGCDIAVVGSAMINAIDYKYMMNQLKSV